MVFISPNSATIYPTQPKTTDDITLACTARLDAWDIPSGLPFAVDTTIHVCYRYINTAAYQQIYSENIVDACWHINQPDQVCFDLSNPTHMPISMNIGTFPAGEYEIMVCDDADLSSALTGGKLDRIAIVSIQVTTDPTAPCVTGAIECNPANYHLYSCDNGIWMDTGESCDPTVPPGGEDNWYNEYIQYLPYALLVIGAGLMLNKRSKSRGASTIVIKDDDDARSAPPPAAAPIVIMPPPYPPQYPPPYPPPYPYSQPPAATSQMVANAPQQPEKRAGLTWEPPPAYDTTRPPTTTRKSRRKTKKRSGKGLTKTQCLARSGYIWITGSRKRKGYCRRK